MKDSVIGKFSVRELDAELFTPFTISSGSHRSLENALFTLEAAGGVKGFGEAAIATHITGETRGRTIGSLQRAGRLLEGCDAANYLGAMCVLEAELDGNRAALAAAQMALLDLAARLQGLSLFRFFGGRCPRVKTDVTVVIGGGRRPRVYVENAPPGFPHLQSEDRRGHGRGFQAPRGG